MTRLKGDYLPTAMTRGEKAAIRAADAQGWIPGPPVYNCLSPAPKPKWTTADVRFLVRRGLTDLFKRRADGHMLFRLRKEDRP